MSTRKMIHKRTIDYFANYPSAIKKTLKRTEEKETYLLFLRGVDLIMELRLMKEGWISKVRGLYDFIPGKRELFPVSKSEEKRLLYRIWKRLKTLYSLNYTTMSDRGRKRISFLDRRGSDPGFTGEKMASLHILCSSSETILLRRLDLKSLFYDWIMTILTENALILRDPGGAMLELRICIEDPGLQGFRSSWISLELRGACVSVVVILVAVLLEGTLVIKTKRTS